MSGRATAIGWVALARLRYPRWMARTKKPKVQIKRQRVSLGWAYRICTDGAYLGSGLTQASARDGAQRMLRRNRLAALRVLELTERNGVSGGSHRGAPNARTDCSDRSLMARASNPTWEFCWRLHQVWDGDEHEFHVIAPVSSLTIQRLGLALPFSRDGVIVVKWRAEFSLR